MVIAAAARELFSSDHRRGFSPLDAQILLLLRLSGEQHAGQLAAATGVSRSTIARALGSLQGDGKVSPSGAAKRPKPYGLTTHGLAAADEAEQTLKAAMAAPRVDELLADLRVRLNNQ